MEAGTYLGILFDLDGVLVDTAKFHYLAWKKTAARWGYELTEEGNEHLKGVSRSDSLKWLLNQAGVQLSDKEFADTLDAKNQDYLDYVSSMTGEDLLPGAMQFLKECRALGFKLALASASKNAPFIISKLGIDTFFDAIADGNNTTQGKPHPEVFLNAAAGLGILPEKCIAIEDSIHGIDAAIAAGCLAIGIGQAQILKNAHRVFGSLADFSIKDITDPNLGSL